MWLWEVVVIIGLSVTAQAGDLDFPPGFKWGAATAAYQIEGAWNVSDKGISIWDHLVHSHPEVISDRSTGDVACDSYNLWQRDIQMAKELGLDFYRFSISWPRLLPSGFTDKISEDGTRYYNNLIDGLLEAGIEPVVTIYHWDLPQRLQDLGGWLTPLSSDWFADYSREAFSLFGDRVKRWITINEPVVQCIFGYGMGWTAPRMTDLEVAPYLCIKHILLAHGKAYRIYDKEFRPQHNGKVSFSNHIIWYEGETEADDHLAERARQYMIGLYSHPVYSKDGGWPPVLADYIAERSKAQGFTRSRLPEFTSNEIEILKGAYDFYGINFYTSRTVRAAKPGEVGDGALTGSSELGLHYGVRDGWRDTASGWFKENAQGLRRALGYIKQQYGEFEVLVTENGYSAERTLDADEDLNDYLRSRFFVQYLEQMLLSIKEDGVNVTGYTAWSLMDNFEWTDGYTKTFGLYSVDMESAERVRTPRLSAAFYRTVVNANSLNVDFPQQRYR